MVVNLKNLYCGIDIGTSSAKTVVFNDEFEPLFKESISYELINENKDWVALDPDEVYQAVFNSLINCYDNVKEEGYDLSFISFSSQLHSLIAVDENNNPLTNCITWADNRAGEFTDHIKKLYKEHDFYTKTGCPPHALYWPARIMWLKKHRKETFNNTAKIVSIKDYIFKKLTDQYVIDYSLASGTGLLNIHKKEWEQDILDILKINEDILPDLVDGKDTLEMKPEIQSKLGKNIPLVVGSGDGPLANLGAGTISSRQLVVTIGTSGAARVFSDEPVLDKQGDSIWCYMLDEDVYLPGGAINNGGGIVLDWLENNIYSDFPGNFYKEADKYIEEVPAGSRGLLILPFLTGERSPNWDPYAKGIMVGLSLSHDKKDIIKAAVEGITFRMYSVVKVLEKNLGKFDEVLVNGGFTNSEPWLQLMADIFGSKIVVPSDPEASALGAVFMGMVASNIVDDYTDIESDMNIKEIKEPRQDIHQKYQEIYSLHEEIYNANSQFFKTVSEL